MEETWDEITPNFKISGKCLESYPCQHFVIVNGKEEMWSGVEICKYLKDNNLPMLKHFLEYNKFT